MLVHPITKNKRFAAGILLTASFLLGEAPQAAARTLGPLSARSAVIVDADDGGVLYQKNAHLKLPPASTTKLMTALVAMDHLPAKRLIPVSRNAAGQTPSRAGLKAGVRYRAGDLVTAALVASSNDAAVALAEAVAGSERRFADMMNKKARQFGMKNTHFVNATGLPDPGKRQVSTAYDLALLMRRAMKTKRIDSTMGITTTRFQGNDGRWISLRNHNKMLWRRPKLVKGKTGWTFASRHTFVGTDYAPDKRITFAMLNSKDPWVDIERLATFGLILEKRRR